ncbi:MAG: hypothetical protein R3D67_19490 [Hyphomicrobiaceae bacterium]
MPETIGLCGDAEAQEKAAARLFVEAQLGGAGGHGVAGVDVGDAGCDVERRGVGEHPGGIGEHVAAAALGHPERAEAAGLGTAREGCGIIGGKCVERGPDSELAEIHLGRSPDGGVGAR